MCSYYYSQNQLQSLPVHICTLPLKILKASHNHINVIPCEIGLLNKLQAMVGVFVESFFVSQGLEKKTKGSW